MSFLSRTNLCVAVAVILMPLAAQAAAPFRICAEPDNLPMSQQSTGTGYEIDVARLLAKDLGRPLEVKWVPQRDHSYFRETIGSGACDAIMSVPAGFKKLGTTRPWYRTGFFFVTPKDKPAPASFDDSELREATIGIPSTGLGDTPPEAALTERSLQAQLRPYSILEPAELMKAVARHDVDMAIIWGPFAGWYADKEKKPLSIAPTPPKDGPMPFVFDISIGLRKEDPALKRQLDLALEHQQAAIAEVLDRWHVPLRKD